MAIGQFRRRSATKTLCGRQHSSNPSSKVISNPVTSSGQSPRVQPELIQFICVNLCLSACIGSKKKRISQTADDKGLTQIHADKENRYLHNSEPNRFDIISQKSFADKIAFPCKESGKASAFICVYLRFPYQSKKYAISLLMTNN
jgi:hypothetical protein